jgi:exonuclease VII large subunit
VTPIAQSQIAVPKTAQELARLIQRRDELRDQLEELTEQRSELASHVSRIGASEPAVVRAGPVSRLQAADERITKLSRDLQVADDAILEAKSKGVTGDGDNHTEVYVNAPTPPSLPTPIIFGDNFGTHQPSWRDRALDSLQVNGPITLLSVLLVGAVIYWRLSRSMKNQINRLQATQTGALMQLQQSLDSVAVEIERVSENQRFVTKLVGEKQPAERR